VKDSWDVEKLKGAPLAEQVGNCAARAGSLGYAKAMTDQC